ncbi:hypothetical protein ABT186_01865 [Streptomyces sp. NPDC001634]|uniref:hypothetical protein n=1 Tax=Streptomyces sp. NPDC001634 TaxID=3154390 RepID=UPI003316C949
MSATATPTAPLSDAARAALHRLERAFADRSVNDVLAHEAGSYVRRTEAVNKAVVQYEIAAATVDRLTAMDARDMAPAQFDSLAEAQKRMAQARATLAAAGQLHLVVS